MESSTVVPVLKKKFRVSESLFLDMEADFTTDDLNYEIYRSERVSHRKLNFLRPLSQWNDGWSKASVLNLVEESKMPTHIRLPRGAGSQEAYESSGKGIVHLEVSGVIDEEAPAVDFEIIQVQHDVDFDHWERVHEAARDRRAPNAISEMYRRAYKSGGKRAFWIGSNDSQVVGCFAISESAEGVVNFWGLSVLPGLDQVRVSTSFLRFALDQMSSTKTMTLQVTEDSAEHEIALKKLKIIDSQTEDVFVL